MLTLTDPNVAFLLLVIGLVGLAWELHAPGGLFPGIAGAVFFLAGIFGLWENSPTWYGSALILTALLLFAFEGKQGSHGISGIAGAVLFGLGAVTLLRRPHSIHPIIACSVAVGAGMIAIFLGYLALQTRHVSARTGVETLVGEFGVSRTQIGSSGTVFVRGEYWQAKSQSLIPPDSRVLIDKVQGLTLHVREA